MCGWKRTLVFVSHDRDFLNFVSIDIIHFHNEKIHFYRGNFDSFQSIYGQKCKETNKTFHVYEKQLKDAKCTGSRAQQKNVKDQAIFSTNKWTTKSSGKGKTIDNDKEPIEA